MIKNIMKASLLLAAITVMMGACSKDDKPGDPPVPSGGKSMKLTITTTGLLAGDHLTMNVAGSTISGTAKTLYKLNNITQENQPAFNVDQAKLAAGPVVIESVVPLFLTAVSLGGFSAPGHSFTVKIIPVIDGKEQAAVSKAFTTQASSQTYRFE